MLLPLGLIAASGGALPPVPITVEYLVVAGGAGGGSSTWVNAAAGGGGGAGGYRSSVGGELSGRNSAAEQPLALFTNTNYTVTIGAGGTGGPAGGSGGFPTDGSNGSNSTFATIASSGGGFGLAVRSNTAGSGGSGGGAASATNDRPTFGGAGTAGQGFAGGTSNPNSVNFAAASGGGGAGAAGANVLPNDLPSAGGVGISSLITGTSTFRAGGGGGGGFISPTNGAAGGSGGGGRGGNQNETGVAGTANTGGGGGGGGGQNGVASGGNGGSGAVIVRYPSSFDIGVGGSLASTTATVGTNKVTTFTAGTGTIAFSGTAPAGSFDLIETVSLSSSAASVTFSSLGTYASTYRHLQIRAVGRSDRTTFANDILIISFNNNTTRSNYADHTLWGGGNSGQLQSGVNSAANWGGAVAGASIGDLSSPQGVANQFAVNVIDILDPFVTTKNTTVRNLSGFMSSDTAGYAGTQVRLNSAAFLSTTAITSITLDQAFGSNFTSGSRFSLYGVK